MKAADRSGAVFALVLGDRELAERSVELKNLKTELEGVFADLGLL